MRFHFAAFLLIASAAAQDVRPKDVREIGKGGAAAVPRLTELLKNPSTDVRVEAVKQLTDARALDALIQATKDNEADVQIQATDGLVNFYMPGYVQTGFGASIKRVGGSIKGKFTDTNDQIVDPYVTARPDVIQALGSIVRGGASMPARANAARAVGILRGKGAVPDLVFALRTKDTDVLYESLIAMQKIRDESAGPQIVFLLRDLNPKVQIAAIETTGLLRNREAVPDLIDVLKHAKDAKVRRAALGSLAMLPDEKSRGIYQQYLTDKDEKMRAGAAEGFARLRNPADSAMIEQAWKDEGKTSPRLSLAFAMVMLGRNELSEFSPLQYLINNLNSSAYKGEALPFLTELARDNGTRKALYGPLETGTRDEKIGLSRVLAVSGDKESVAHLEKASRDTDPDVAKEGLRAMRNLQARL
jgi:HEAT repeat protein